jgi:hypothetical protein
MHFQASGGQRAATSMAGRAILTSRHGELRPWPMQLGQASARWPPSSAVDFSSQRPSWQGHRTKERAPTIVVDVVAT